MAYSLISRKQRDGYGRKSMNLKKKRSGALGDDLRTLVNLGPGFDIQGDAAIASF